MPGIEGNKFYRIEATIGRFEELDEEQGNEIIQRLDKCYTGMLEDGLIVDMSDVIAILDVTELVNPSDPEIQALGG